MITRAVTTRAAGNDAYVIAARIAPGLELGPYINATGEAITDGTAVLIASLDDGTDEYAVIAVLP